MQFRGVPQTCVIAFYHFAIRLSHITISSICRASLTLAPITYLMGTYTGSDRKFYLGMICMSIRSLFIASSLGGYPKPALVYAFAMILLAHFRYYFLHYVEMCPSYRQFRGNPIPVPCSIDHCIRALLAGLGRQLTNLFTKFIAGFSRLP